VRSLRPTRPFAAVRRPPTARSRPLRPAEIAAVFGANAVVVVGMWMVHGGLEGLDSPVGLVEGLGQVTALLGTYLALVGVVLAARVPWLDHVIGTDDLMTWHRRVGFATLCLLVGHAVLSTLGWALADGLSFVGEILAMLATWELLLAAIGLGLLIVVAASSIRAARRRLQYETWYGIHLYAYLAIALAFLHQLTFGSDLVDDPVALGYWLALYAVTFGLLLWYRVVAPIRLSSRHRLRVATVVPEAPGVASIYLVGRDLDRLPVRAGQSFQVRFLTGGGWWRPHPFSISAAPNGRFLRLTVKDLGDDSHRMLSMSVGVPVFIEGPYGSMTTDQVTRDRVVMLAGGIGISPLRAMLEELPPAPGAVTLLYRESRPEGIVFRAELSALAVGKGADVRLLVGHRDAPHWPADPLSAAQLTRLVPDLGRADIFVCGSRSFTEHVLESLTALGIARSHVHAERFG
jgi:predicted ferric reductase